MVVPSAPRSPHSHQQSIARLSLWGILGCLLIIATLGACAMPLTSHTATPTATSVPISPEWTAVLKQIGPNGEVSLATAEQAYTLAFGPLPGIQSPAANTGGVIPSGTLALRMILAHYHDLTAAQQQAVLKRFGFAAPTATTHAATRATMAMSDAARIVRLSGPTPIPTDAPGTSPYRAMINAYISKLNGLLSYTLTIPIALSFDPKMVETDTGGGTWGINSQGESTGKPVLCRVALTSNIGSFPIDDQRLIVAHELFHCYQLALMGDLHAFAYAPDWLIEGSAEWAGAVISGATANTDWLKDWWEAWLNIPSKRLFSRSYDALGFYALLNQVGISPWSVLPAMLLSQTKGTVPDNADAYQAAMTTAPQKVLDVWASSYNRDRRLGSAWDLTGPGIPKTESYQPPAYAISNGKTLSGATPAYTALDYDLDPEADVIKINVNGVSRLHDGGTFERVGSANGIYCVKQGGCACPGDTTSGGFGLPQLQGALFLAITGGSQGASGSVTGMTLQQFCAQPVLCQIISPAEFSQVVGGPVAKVNGSITHTPAAQQVVICNYLPPKLPGDGGAIDFALSSNGMDYYAKLKLEEANGLNSVNDVSGVGDAAFWGTETSSPDTLDFDMVKGNWVVGIVITGSAADGSIYLAGVEQMAKEIASNL